MVFFKFTGVPGHGACPLVRPRSGTARLTGGGVKPDGL